MMARYSDGFRSIDPKTKIGPWVIHESPQIDWMGMHTVSHAPTGLAVGHSTLEICEAVVIEYLRHLEGADTEDPDELRESIPEDVRDAVKSLLLRRSP